MVPMVLTILLIAKFIITSDLQCETDRSAAPQSNPNHDYMAMEHEISKISAYNEFSCDCYFSEESTSDSSSQSNAEKLQNKDSYAKKKASIPKKKKDVNVLKESDSKLGNDAGNNQDEDSSSNSEFEDSDVESNTIETA